MTAPRRQRVWLFALVALLLHAVLFVVIKREFTEASKEQALGGKFVKRRPLRQHVLRRRFAPEPTRRALRRRMAVPAAFARATATEARVPAAAGVLRARAASAVLARPLPRAGLGISSTGRLRAAAADVEVAAEERLDLDLELLDVEAMDTGRYRALVVEDPSDRRALTGFVHLAAVGIRSAIEAAANSDRYDRQAGNLASGALLAVDWRPLADVRALDELARELQAHTRLKAAVDQGLFLGEDGWMDTPFVLLTGAAEFEPTINELTSLGRYLVSGGFAYVEVVGHNTREADFYGHLTDLRSLRGLVEQALTGQGLRRAVDWEIRRLPQDHPLFASYYDMDTMPRPFWSVMRAHIVDGYQEFFDHAERFGFGGQEAPYLEGIFVKGRLAGVYSQQNYRDLWSRRLERKLMGTGMATDFYDQTLGNRFTGDQALRLGINAVVYALTQEGSLARQYVVRE